ncbi:MAG: glucosyl-3-phosphoglycerate synthase [Candidatus Aerophobetes bacterium]|nr:glucosyl-3-phosphoglycerate synthase [Candidatus Aerophobetes bacterium]
MKLDEWIDSNTYHHSSFSNITRLVRLKKKKGLTISLAFPTLNEEETIAQEVKVIKEELQDKYPLLDEIAVIDSGSTDRTRELAHRAGARVYLASDYLPEYGTTNGKGENLWKSLYLLKGDIITWIDADIKNIHPKFVYGILGPLLEYEHIKYVKAFYQRPLVMGKKVKPAGGGRVTEILVRPLLANFYPELSGFLQPLSGEYAGRREILEAVPFRVGYGVEIGLLIDIYEKWGLKALAQVDLDKRVHRNRSLSELGEMSFAILHTFFTRLQERGIISLKEKVSDEFKLVKGRGEKIFLKKEEFTFIERPPMNTVEKYQQKRENIAGNNPGAARSDGLEPGK